MGNAETMPLGFKLELESLRDPGSLNGWEKLTCSVTWHAMDAGSSSSGFWATSLSQRGGSSPKLGDHDSSKSHNPLIHSKLMCKGVHMNRMVMT